MGCRNDYMEPNAAEKAAGKIELLLEEVKIGSPVNPDAYRVAHKYNVSQDELDQMTADLCSELQGIGDVSVYSLELQVWWRDHQAADARRVKDEIQAHQDEADRKAAIAKLSPHERSLLKLD